MDDRKMSACQPPLRTNELNQFLIKGHSLGKKKEGGRLGTTLSRYIRE